MIVRTVLGDMDPAELGQTYVHEHFIIDSERVAPDMPEIHLPSVDEAVAELDRCRTAGLGAAVDAMPGIQRTTGPANSAVCGLCEVEPIGLEPTTSCMPCKRSPN